MTNKIILTKNQAGMIENHRNNFEVLMEKRYLDNCPTSIDNLSLDEVVSAYFDGYDIKKEWYETKDELVFSDNFSSNIKFRCNFENWGIAKNKESSYSNPLIAVINEEYDDVYCSLSLNNMIKLRNYLTQKINFLNTDEQDIDDMF